MTTSMGPGRGAPRFAAAFGANEAAFADARGRRMPSSSIARFFNRCFCTLPEAVRGRESVMTALFGTLNLASRPMQWAMSAAAVIVRPGTGTT